MKIEIEIDTTRSRNDNVVTRMVVKSQGTTKTTFEGKYKNHIEQCLYSDTLGDSDGEMDTIEIWTQPVLP